MMNNFIQFNKVKIEYLIFILSTFLISTSSINATILKSDYPFSVANTSSILYQNQEEVLKDRLEKGEVLLLPATSLACITAIIISYLAQANSLEQYHQRWKLLETAKPKSSIFCNHKKIKRFNMKTLLSFSKNSNRSKDFLQFIKNHEQTFKNLCWNMDFKPINAPNHLQVIANALEVDIKVHESSNNNAMDMLEVHFVSALSKAKQVLPIHIIRDRYKSSLEIKHGEECPGYHYRPFLYRSSTSLDSPIKRKSKTGGIQHWGGKNNTSNQAAIFANLDHLPSINTVNEKAIKKEENKKLNLNRLKARQLQLDRFKIIHRRFGKMVEESEKELFESIRNGNLDKLQEKITFYNHAENSGLIKTLNYYRIIPLPTIVQVKKKMQNSFETIKYSLRKMNFSSYTYIQKSKKEKKKYFIECNKEIKMLLFAKEEGYIHENILKLTETVLTRNIKDIKNSAISILKNNFIEEEDRKRLTGYLEGLNFFEQFLHLPIIEKKKQEVIEYQKIIMRMLCEKVKVVNSKSTEKGSQYKNLEYSFSSISVDGLKTEEEPKSIINFAYGRAAQQRVPPSLEQIKIKVRRLVKDFFKNQREDAIEKLAQYIQSDSSRLLISKEDKKNLLSCLNKDLEVGLKKFTYRTKILDLSLRKSGEQDFVMLKKIMSTLDMLQEYNITATFKGLSKYHNNILRSSTDKVKLAVRGIAINFNREEQNLETQKKCLHLLQKYEKSIKTLQSVESIFYKILQKLPEGIRDQKALEKDIDAMNQKIKKAEDDMRVWQNKEKKTIEECDDKIKRLKDAKIYFNELIDLIDDPEIFERKIREYLIKQGFSFTCASKLKDELKKQLEKKKNRDDEIEKELAHRKKEINQYKQQKQYRETSLQAYSKNKERQEEKIRVLFNLLSQELLPISLLEKLRNRDTNTVQWEIEKLKKDIDFCVKNHLEAVPRQINPTDISQALLYLKRAGKVKWVDRYEGIDDESSIASDEFVDMEFILQRADCNLVDYLENHVMTIKKEVDRLLDVFYQELLDQSRLLKESFESMEKLMSYLKEIETWKKYYDETLFKPYIAKEFVCFCTEQLTKIVEILERYLVHYSKIEIMAKVNQIAIKISTLSDLWGSASRRARGICENYDKKSFNRVNNQK